MREIKFRAWDKENKRMCVVHTLSSDGFIKAEEDMEDYSFEHRADYGEWEAKEKLENYEIMQYTGLKDKNGKEIYEGDIVESVSGRVCEVAWFSSPQFAGWDLKVRNAKGEAPRHSVLWKGWEVIGNIYEDKLND